MANQDFSEFYERIARIEKARAQGFGFEAEGTLGRSHYHKPKARRRRFIAPLLAFTLCCLVLKGALHHQVGGATYLDRVDQMQTSESGIERIAAVLMQADPITLWVSAQLSTYFP